MADRYKPDWASLRTHVTPQWIRDDKFGIYTHWGLYSVPAAGPNGTWYAYNMYREGTAQHKHHIETYGHPGTFGYKDFIPQLTAAKFDADEWAELFKQAGARFAGPVGEHHDGFTMWDTEHSEWHAGRLGPKRDVVGEQERAFRKAGMRFMIAMHHAEWWWFYPHWRKEYDTGAENASGLYGEPHNLEWAETGEPEVERDRYWLYEMDRPSRAFLEQWLAKLKEATDKYTPDLFWFDFGVNWVQERYVKEFLAYYYNRGAEWNKDVVVTYKWHNMVPGSALLDFELGGENELTHHDWITDTTVDTQGAWSYVEDAGFKPASVLVHNLIDNVSKNGYMLLNVGPRPDGTIPEGAEETLRGIGRWLEINGEAIFETTPWKVPGEGPTKVVGGGAFTEATGVVYSGRDIRYTIKGDVLYAHCLGWPGAELTLKAPAEFLYPGEVVAVTMLGSDEPLSFRQTREDLTIGTPRERVGDHAFVFKIERRDPHG